MAAARAPAPSAEDGIKAQSTPANMALMGINRIDTRTVNIDAPDLTIQSLVRRETTPASFSLDSLPATIKRVATDGIR